MMELGAKLNLVVCQKSKIDDWVEHFRNYYHYDVEDLTKRNDFECFMDTWDIECGEMVGVINYELAFRRPELKKLKDFTLLLDESSLIQNENAKRSKFILNLNAENVILLSGTPTGGKYERLWSQCKLLGWNIKKKLFYDQYVNYHYDDNEGFPIMIIDGYKNVERLKSKLHNNGAVFMKTEEVFDLPGTIDQTIKIRSSSEYKTFRNKRVLKLPNGEELVGDTSLTKMLYERQLCAQYSASKLEAFRELVESTNDRLIVFYNFTAELTSMLDIVEQKLFRPTSIVNGDLKKLSNYEHRNDSVTFIQYQAGAMGLNLQKANKIIYFSPPLSSELFEQSKARTHRIGQERTCFYYYLTVVNSVETKIYKALSERRDYTEKLFEKE